MKAMRNFWAREWLMRDIGAKHGTNDVSTIIKIAQTAGLLSSNACLGPLKLCHYLLTKGVTDNGTETVFG